jgi:hypothetical protein
MSSGESGAATVIEKTMSASESDFHRGMAVLDATRAPALTHVLGCGGGLVTISYDARPGVRLGTLLALPRACVRLRFEGATADERSAFLARFDLAFQRGGG